MNNNLLLPNIQQFIKENLSVDITKLILKGSPFKKITTKELANQIVATKKSKEKLPTWFYNENIYFPEKTSIEQTSSEITANYKSKLISGNSIIDITGGFGVDCYYFSKHFNSVTHCEINEELSLIVQHNYKQLKIKNITTIACNGLDYLKKNDKKYDCIYIDPSRRNEVKGKVFLLNDCSPNLPQNLELLFSKSATLLVKTSPILDITSAINELNHVKEVHIVAVKNEVKELLFLMKKDTKEPCQIKTVNILNDKTDTFNFEYKTKATSVYSEPNSYLYEPNSAILKSGGFHHISEQLKVNKLHQHSHLYTSNTLIDFPGRCFKIKNIIPYDKKQLNKLLPDKKANITVRNFTKTVAQIRKETKIKEGGNMYLFFTTLYNKKLCVIICNQISYN